jgi:hypothetical protein
MPVMLKERRRFERQDIVAAMATQFYLIVARFS